ncbi:hypothetical protein IP86_17405 [Rhodopseudomonas sp. AAP120]|nr:hypothetical protein Rpal_1097 [Rhodopseudomonas palustris TIE-1]KPF96190.1 hypothetical protein IP86_17405 [Rhodopseudomonas sp. AAP120]
MSSQRIGHYHNLRVSEKVLKTGRKIWEDAKQWDVAPIPASKVLPRVSEGNRQVGNLPWLIVPLVASTIGLNSAWAHNPGIGAGEGGGGILTIGAATLERGQFAFSVFSDYLRLKQLGEATLLANVGNDVHGIKAVESRAFALAYGVTDDFTISVRAPWVERTGILEAFTEGSALTSVVRDRGDAAGFGDVTLLGQYRFMNEKSTGTQGAVLFGVKLPTGRTDVVDRFGSLFDAEFQPGSGSWDALFGAALSQRLTSSLGFHANILAIARHGSARRESRKSHALQCGAFLSCVRRRC